MSRLKECNRNERSLLKELILFLVLAELKLVLALLMAKRACAQQVQVREKLVLVHQQLPLDREFVE